MKKLKLQAEELTVESFQAGEAEGATGTVEGREMAPTPPYAGCPKPTRMTYDCPCTPAY